ncbi:MAG: plasmid mobilization relaxosome protein MobC [Campylobacterota bacterium]|nr:plasmid mobilization relaxosome protein MobC [Campylobacterota bacterium]
MKNKVVGIRLSEEELQSLIKKAELAKMKMSAYIRDILLKDKVVVQVIDTHDKLIKLRQLSLLSSISNNANQLAKKANTLGINQTKTEILEKLDELLDITKTIVLEQQDNWSVLSDTEDANVN